MIKLKKGKLTFNVATELQAAAFKKNGWEVVEAETSVSTESVENKEDEKIKYKKSDISKMNVEDLKKLATELEIEGAEEATGEKLKADIIAKLGL